MNIKQLELLIKRIDEKAISKAIATELFSAMLDSKSEIENLVDYLIEEKGLKQLAEDPTNKIKDAIEKILSDNPYMTCAVNDVNVNFLIGKVMQIMKGKCNPSIIRKLVISKLKEHVAFIPCSKFGISKY